MIFNPKMGRWLDVEIVEKRDFMMPGWMYGRGHVCKELLVELINTRVTIGNTALTVRV